MALKSFKLIEVVIPSNVPMDWNRECSHLYMDRAMFETGQDAFFGRYPLGHPYYVMDGMYENGIFDFSKQAVENTLRIPAYAIYAEYDRQRDPLVTTLVAGVRATIDVTSQLHKFIGQLHQTQPYSQDGWSGFLLIGKPDEAIKFRSKFIVGFYAIVARPPSPIADIDVTTPLLAVDRAAHDKV